jgi:hypothetical protein
VPVFNESPSVVKQFNTLSYEGDTGWELEYVQTDIDNIGVVPTITTNYNTTLQLSGSAPQSIFEGANTVTSIAGSNVTWAIFVSPLNSQYAFDTVNFGTEVILTPSASSSLTVTNPTAVTDGELVFLVQHTVGTNNSIQTLNISGSGAELAFTVALLTVNIADTVSNANITPASIVFNTAGPSFVIFTIDASPDYYIDGSNVIVNTSGMPTSTAVGTPAPNRVPSNSDNLRIEIPITVPTAATAGTITAGGVAILKPTLTWSPVPVHLTTQGVIGIPSGTQTGIAYGITPFDFATQRFATITYTADDDKVLTEASFTAQYNVNGTVITKSTQAQLAASNYGTLVLFVQLPIITSDTTATPVITGTGQAVATLGTPPATETLLAAGTAITITNTWNVNITVSANNTGDGVGWFKFNGIVGTAVVLPGASFTISADPNTAVGAVARSAEAVISCSNGRIVPSLTDKTIVVTQNA